MIKNILGLDLGTNSIGWALIEINPEDGSSSIQGAGSRIIPMTQDVLGKFDSGQKISQTAERTRLRTARRLRERYLLRRERLHRVLNILGFLPEHYAVKIDFEKRLGQFLPETEPKLAYSFNTESGKSAFLFQSSFEEMMAEFAQYQPQLLEAGKKIPYDWTIYYLRRKALTQKIEKAELAWLLLQFNQKRGYNQLRGEEEEETPANKRVEFHSLRVVDVTDSDDRKKDETWYNVHLENGWIYRRPSKVPLDWTGKTKEFIVTTELNDDGTVKTDKDGKEKRSFRSPAADDWTLVKKRTEHEIELSGKTVGEYIYCSLLQNPAQKIKGKLVRTIERKFYKDELKRILEKQLSLHAELQDKQLYQQCLDELYEHNEAHQLSIGNKDFVHLFLNDILFYQRPLKSKKSLISNCKFESKPYVVNGVLQREPVKCIARSHPLFQEFRVWKFLQSLRIYQKEKIVNGKLETDVDVTTSFLPTAEDQVQLFDWLNERKEIDQKTFLKYPGFKLKKNVIDYRWNFPEEKTYPCNETRALLESRLSKVPGVPADFLSPDNTESLWHILYSVEDKTDIIKALKTFAAKKELPEEFVEQFRKFPSFKKEYGAYSAKAIKKLLPLMRLGKNWSADKIHPQTRERIEKLLTGEFDEKIRDRVREKALTLTHIDHFQGLPEWLASYIVYDRHSEDAGADKWKTAAEIRLLPQHSLRNPIVEQLINESLQVVRDIWNEYGQGKEGFFDEIHVELGREMKNTLAEREKISKQMAENENTNLRIKALLIEMLNDPAFENVRPYSPMQQDILRIYEEGALNAQDGNIPEEILKISKLAQPTNAELSRYKLWLEQKYRSPYTGNMIPLSKLFTPAYEIEHIIPQSRYFDNSFSNKVICETAINRLKENATAFEFILKKGGTIVELGMGQTCQVFKKENYELFIKDNYGKMRGKMKKLLMEDIPESFIQRQLNDSRYISREVKTLLSNIVREEGEQESTAKRVIMSNGSITAKLKQDWGLNDVWNDIITPRFERLNELTKSNNYGEWTNKEGKRVFQIQMPLELQRGFNKKRIDHRHHALDAIIVACTTRDHINFLNNENALEKGSKEEKEKKRYDLRYKLCDKKYNDARKENYKWQFKKPWDDFTVDCKEILAGIIVSFKQNQRVINKSVNHIQQWQKDQDGNILKKRIKQSKGDSWAIRQSMHKDTVSGLVKLKLVKTVPLSSALDNWEMIVDKSFKKHIQQLVKEGATKKSLVSLFKNEGASWEGKDISRLDIYYWDIDKEGKGNNAASRVSMNEKFDTAMIRCITDTGIQQIMLRHLEKYNEIKDDKVIEHPAIAFSPDGIDEMNKNIQELNNGKPHQPIYKVRTFEVRGNKFQVGSTGNKTKKYVEAAKGTNLFFAIYQDDKGNRVYESIPLNIVIERQKQDLPSVPEIDGNGNKLLMFLSPNDLVYVPSSEQSDQTASLNIDPDQVANMQVYKMVSSSGSQCFFVRHDIATPIVNKFEYSPGNKMERSIEGAMIKEVCTKIKVDRLGKITQSHIINNAHNRYKVNNV
ncbi:MAG: HNH endonuclease domain-containing protein [Candidatus Pseudobacter hemicellulosilyticus]|uniref:CRISPR-associated endonuclease Cas9 n=1 Tax=Candidatus Pseudobacter hemicellulosilyticus TaxID=3121375 RepID=A0AAJ5WSQ6_9BACT|nr:MAG: HNH endonuclease domain-containing protein [Pseudobacter sp.]